MMLVLRCQLKLTILGRQNMILKLSFLKEYHKVLVWRDKQLFVWMLLGRKLVFLLISMAARCWETNQLGAVLDSASSMFYLYHLYVDFTITWIIKYSPESCQRCEGVTSKTCIQSGSEGFLFQGRFLQLWNSQCRHREQCKSIADVRCCVVTPNWHLDRMESRSVNYLSHPISIAAINTY